ncbi:MAG: hypothetical protein ACXVRM_07800 [Solirubrobacteraceae bacterium]
MTIGGINLGVSAFSPHPDDAFEAIKWLANKQNQATDAVKGGLPPTLAALYDDPAVQKAHPFSRPDQAVPPVARDSPADPGLLRRLARLPEGALAAELDRPEHRRVHVEESD